MRCRNCHTGLMATDLECPACHAAAPSANSAPPDAIAGDSGVKLAFGVGGGLIGLLLYGVITGLARAFVRSGGSQAAAERLASGRPGPLRLVFGGLLILVGGGLVALAGFHIRESWQIEQRTLQEVTAGELRQAEGPESLPGTWLSYTCDDSKTIVLPAARRHLGRTGDVQARRALVKVEDVWLIASVAPDFDGKRLVGRLQALDLAVSPDLIAQIQESAPDVEDLLPYEFNAMDGSASDPRLRYIQAGWSVTFGLLGVLLGLRLVRGRRQTASKERASKDPPFAFRALQNG